jgi:hypothetical protein
MPLTIAGLWRYSTERGPFERAHDTILRVKPEKPKTNRWSNDARFEKPCCRQLKP